MYLIIITYIIFSISYITVWATGVNNNEMKLSNCERTKMHRTSILDITCKVNNMKENSSSTAIVKNIFQKARKEALNGGLSGAAGGVVQVITLMWLRTVVNYQYRYNVGIVEAMKILYQQGGILRFYQGVTYAIIQGPLAKFGAVAANEGAKEYIKAIYSENINQKMVVATALGSVLAALWRALLMPIDTCKTVLQVEGSEGFDKLINSVYHGNILLLYEGTFATMLATLIAHYPWFFTYNLLDAKIPKVNSFKLKLLRNAFIGFVSSALSDSLSNIIRVVKTVKQSSAGSSASLSYYKAVKQIYSEGGIAALFGRGLLLRIITNGIQSILFVVVWKMVASYLSRLEDSNLQLSQRSRTRTL